MNADGTTFDDERRAFEAWLDKYQIGADLIVQSGEEAAFVLSFQKVGP